LSNFIQDAIDDTCQCQLYVVYGEERTLVAHGKVFQAAIDLHGMNLSDNIIKITVVEVHILDALVLVPIDEVYTMVEAFQSFLT